MDPVLKDPQLQLLRLFAQYPPTVGKKLKKLRLKSEEFDSVTHQYLFEQMIALFEQTGNFNRNELAQELKQIRTSQGKTRFQACGGNRFLDEIYEECPTQEQEQIETYINDIRGSNELTQVREAFYELQAKLDDRPKLDEFLSFSIAKLEHLKKRHFQSLPYIVKTLDSQISELRLSRSELESKTKKYLGLSTGFPILSESINGIGNEFYLIAGASSMGKTTMMTQLAYMLAKLNPDVFVIFYSFDQNYLDIIAKFVALDAELKVDYVKNPQLLDISKEKQRLDSLEKINQLKERLLIVDQTSGVINLQDIKNLTRKVISETELQVVVLIDSLTALEDNLMASLAPSAGNVMATFHNIISHEIKSLSRVEKIPVIATCRIMPSAENKRPSKMDLATYSAYLYDAYAIILIYCEYMVNFDTPFLEWAWQTEDVMVPIVELNIIKNKMFEFRGRLFYRYFNSIAKYRECAKLEIENFNEMITNIQEYRSMDEEQMKKVRFKEAMRDEKP